MNGITNYILYGILATIFISVGGYMLKLYSKFKDPTKNSIFLRKRTTYYNYVYHNEIEPIIVEFFKKYITFLSGSSFSFDKFFQFVSKLKKGISRSKKLNSKEIKIMVNTSDIFENIPQIKLDSKIITKLIKGCENFSKFNKTLKKIKITGITFIIFTGIETVLLIIFGYFKNTYNFFLGVNIIFGVITIILFLLIYFRFYKDISHTIKTFDSQPWIIKGGNEDS